MVWLVAPPAQTWRVARCHCLPSLRWLLRPCHNQSCAPNPASMHADGEGLCPYLCGLRHLRLCYPDPPGGEAVLAVRRRPLATSLFIARTAAATAPRPLDNFLVICKGLPLPRWNSVLSAAHKHSTKHHTHVTLSQQQSKCHASGRLHGDQAESQLAPHPPRPPHRPRGHCRATPTAANTVVLTRMVE